MLQIPVNFKLKAKKVHIVVIGLGGTGSHMADNILRIAKYLTLQGTRDIICTFADGDIVEAKNCERQNFFTPDIHKNKAEVQASRYGRLFGMEVSVVKNFIEDVQMLKDICFVDDYFPIIVSCVDNHETRKMIWQMFQEMPEKLIWLDSGNSQFTGQVIMGYNSSTKLDGNRKNPHMFKTPCIMEVHPEILDKKDKFKSEESCDDRAVENIQNIAANITSSTCQFNILNALLSETGISIYMLRFNAQTGAVSSFANTKEELAQYYK